MNARSLAVAAAGTPAARAVVRLLERFAPAGAGRFAVLTYHRILPAERRRASPPGLFSATPAAFAQQMDLIASRCSPISLEQLLDALGGGSTLPGRAVLVTFDDAYRDVIRDAWPVMRRAGIPATVFVPTGFVDGNRAFWWDAVWRGIVRAAARGEHVAGPHGPLWVGSWRARVHAFAVLRARFHRAAPEQLPALLLATFGRRVDAVSDVMGRAELRMLHAEGVALAPHTRNHRILAGSPEPVIRHEVLAGRDDLRGLLGAAPPAFAYPGGRLDARAIDVVREAGYVAAFSTTRGSNGPRRDPLMLRRINVGARATPDAIRAQLVPLGGRRGHSRPEGDDRRLSA